MFNNVFFSFENRAIYEVCWKNIVEPARPQMKIWRNCTACWIPKTKNTHSEYVTLIAFPLQKWFHEHISILLYTYFGCLVVYSVTKYETELIMALVHIFHLTRPINI